MARQKPDEVEEELKDQEPFEGGESTVGGSAPDPSSDDDVDEFVPKDKEPEHVHMDEEKLEPIVEDPMESLKASDLEAKNKKK